MVSSCFSWPRAASCYGSQQNGSFFVNYHIGPVIVKKSGNELIAEIREVETWLLLCLLELLIDYLIFSGSDEISAESMWLLNIILMI